MIKRFLAKIQRCFNEGKNKIFCPAGVSQWTECQAENQRVTSSISSQGTGLGCSQVPSWGCT